MTYQQSLDLAEIEAELAFEKFLAAFEAQEHPEVLDQLQIQADIAERRYHDLQQHDLAH